MTLLFSIATLFLSMAVVVIAWQQWRVARNKLRLDLFDRRWQIYAATRTFMDLAVKDSDHVASLLKDFNTATASAEFLFKADVVNYLEQVRSKSDDVIWLSDPKRITEMTKTFAPYLSFANIKV